MPKERLHILLADESLKAMGSKSFVPDEESRLAFLFGSIFPDMLFYDLPSFRLSPLGGSLHRYEGEAGLEFFKVWLLEEKSSIPKDVQAWMTGVVSHLLTDRFWHPRIGAFSNPPSPPCSKLDLSPRLCHHWLESELEAHWLTVLGPADKYVLLLERFSTEKRLRARYCAWFREFLIRSGLEGVPSKRRIEWCLMWQVLALRRFSSPGWAKWKSRLLGKRPTKFLGALIVPPKSGYIPQPDPALEWNEAGAGLFHPKFMAKAISLLSSLLPELPVRF